MAFLARCAAGSEAMIECQKPVANRVPEVAGYVQSGEHIDQLTVVRGCNNDVRLAAVRVPEELDQHGLACRDPFHGIGSAKQLVKQEEMRRRIETCRHEVQQGFDLYEVIAFAFDEVVGSPDATADVKDRCFVRRGEARVDGLSE